MDKSIEEFKDEVIAIDIAPYVIKAFFADAPAWHRGEEPTHTYRTILGRVIDRLLKHATRLIVVIDGARLPLKAAEHVRRGDATDREATMEQAAEQVRLQNDVEANALYRKLVYPPPDEIYTWLIAHCRTVDRCDILVAPFEADSQAAFLSLKGYADTVITIDGDFLMYGCPSVAFKAGSSHETFGHVELYKTVLGKKIDASDLQLPATLAQLQTMGIPAGCDYVGRVDHVAWPKLSALYAAVADSLGPLATTEEEREALAAKLAAINASKPKLKQRPDYLFSLRGAWQAFSDPLAWEPTSVPEYRTRPDGTRALHWPTAEKLVRVFLWAQCLSSACRIPHPPLQLLWPPPALPPQSPPL